MADTLTIGETRNLLVEGRNPFPDELITSDDPAGAIALVGAAAADGSVPVTGVAIGAVTITVAPGAEDGVRSSGTDAITVVAPPDTSPLAVTLA